MQVMFLVYRLYIDPRNIYTALIVTVLNLVKALMLPSESEIFCQNWYSQKINDAGSQLD